MLAKIRIGCFNFFDLNDGPLAIWTGGLGIYGGVIGGLIGILLYARHAKLSRGDMWLLMDVAAIGLPLGHAIGRWGNFVNQELYGEPTDLPWAITIDNPPLQYFDASRFHPLFLYESLWNVALFGVLLWLWLRHRDRLLQGDVLLLYLAGYNVVRFLLEFIRIETAHLPVIGLNSSQTTSAIVVLLAVGLLIYRHRTAKPEPQTHPDGRPIGKPKKAPQKKSKRSTP